MGKQQRWPAIACSARGVVGVGQAGALVPVVAQVSPCKPPCDTLHTWRADIALRVAQV